MLNKILLLEKDIDYRNALAEAMSNSQKDFEIMIAAITDFEEGKTKNSLNHSDLILIGGHFIKTLESFDFLKPYKRKLVILTEYPVDSLMKQLKKENRRYLYLYKYVRLSELISDLSLLLTWLTGKKHYTRKSIAPNIIGFYSAGGGVGKTAIAIAAARELSRFHDKKVLYLSFEDIPATELYIKTNLVSRNIGDYLYFLLEKKEDNLSGHLKSFVACDSYGVETFPPSGMLNDLRCLSSDEIKHFLESIYDCNRYDFIVIDLNCDFSTDTQLLLEQCNKIILIHSDRPVSEFKNQKLLKYMVNTGFIKSAGMLLFVINKRSECSLNIDDYVESSMGKHRQIYIENDKASFSLVNNSLEIGINHSFGIGVKKIVDELLIVQQA